MYLQAWTINGLADRHTRVISLKSGRLVDETEVKGICSLVKLSP